MWLHCLGSNSATGVITLTRDSSADCGSIPEAALCSFSLKIVTSVFDGSRVKLDKADQEGRKTEQPNRNPVSLQDTVKDDVLLKHFWDAFQAVLNGGEKQIVGAQCYWRCSASLTLRCVRACVHACVCVILGRGEDKAKAPVCVFYLY